MNNPSTLLEKLSKISNENTINVFVPSANRDIKFKALNIKQQKDLIKTALDGAAAGATLNQVLNDIIISNSTEQFEFKVHDHTINAGSTCIDYRNKDQDYGGWCLFISTIINLFWIQSEIKAYVTT